MLGEHAICPVCHGLRVIGVKGERFGCPVCFGTGLIDQWICYRLENIRVG